MGNSCEAILCIFVVTGVTRLRWVTPVKQSSVLFVVTGVTRQRWVTPVTRFDGYDCGFVPLRVIVFCFVFVAVFVCMCVFVCVFVLSCVSIIVGLSVCVIVCFSACEIWALCVVVSPTL